MTHNDEAGGDCCDDNRLTFLGAPRGLRTNGQPLLGRHDWYLIAMSVAAIALVGCATPIRLQVKVASDVGSEPVDRARVSRLRIVPGGLLLLSRNLEWTEVGTTDHLGEIAIAGAKSGDIFSVTRVGFMEGRFQLVDGFADVVSPLPEGNSNFGQQLVIASEFAYPEKVRWRITNGRLSIGLKPQARSQ